MSTYVAKNNKKMNMHNIRYRKKIKVARKEKGHTYNEILPSIE